MNNEKQFREWLLKTYGRQEYNNYSGTQAEEFAIRYLSDYKQAIKKKIEDRIKTFPEFKNRDMAQDAAVDELQLVIDKLDTVKPL